MKIEKKILIFICFLLNIESYTQGLYEDVTNTNIYDLLDELANSHLISLNSSVKPFSKIFIYNKLKEVNEIYIDNNRLKNDIKFYINKYEEYSEKRYNKKKFHLNKSSLQLIYNEEQSKILSRPIWGTKQMSNEYGNFYQYYGGFEADIILNKNWSIYANIRDNTMSEANTGPDYFNNDRGGNYKYSKQNDFSEMKGGLTYHFKSGSIGLLKEHIEWGVNYFGSNILSGRTPSFPLVKLNLNINKLIQLNYIHAWLVSEDIDSSSSYYSSSGAYRGIYREKFMSANFISFILTKKTFFSFGNSIIYGDINGIQPAYLIPVFFYKSIDHTLNNDIENQNSQLFFNFSTREIKNTNIYLSLFIDELSKDRIFDKNENNFLSFKSGIAISNWPFKNIFNNIEITQTNPMTFQHTVEGITFESNKYNLGHYLRDNSRVINYQIKYKLKHRINLVFNYLYAMHGEDKEYNYNNGYSPTSIPILKNKTWDNSTVSFKINHTLKENIYLSLEYKQSIIKGYSDNNFSAEYYLNKFTPFYLHGKTNTFIANLNVGF